MRALISRRFSSASFQQLPILQLPPIDASPEEEAAFSTQLCHACHTIGFFYITAHGVRTETYVNALESAQQFFDLPVKAKLSIDYRNSPAFRGYMDLGCENTAGRPDRREQIEFGVEAEAQSPSSYESTPPNETDEPAWKRLMGPNQWPDTYGYVPTLRPHVTQYLNEMELLSRRLMEYLAMSLDLPRDHFDDTFRDSPNVQFKICRYPPNNNDNDDAKSEHGGFGVGSHTDSGYLSLLLQDNVGGLQVQNGDGEWVPAPPIDDTIVVNLGEMIQLATSGYYLATPHRVKNTDYSPTGTGKGRSRYSMPYFWNPRLDFSQQQIDPLPESLVWERPKPSAESIDCTDSHGTAGNKLHACYGENAFKSLSRAHPQVMERHHKDLL
jgi:isopenicillin N synthase-like dioxygenase